MSRKQLTWWIAAIAWMGFIFYWSSKPNLTSGLTQDYILRKTAHVLEYVILTILYALAIAKRKPQVKQILIAVLMAVLYASSDEWHQMYVPGREGKFTDVLIDSIGMVLAAIALYIYSRQTKKRG